LLPQFFLSQKYWAIISNCLGSACFCHFSVVKVYPTIDIISNCWELPATKN
jgi:hypothetical protein